MLGGVWEHPWEEPEDLWCWVTNTEWQSRDGARTGALGPGKGFRAGLWYSFRLLGGEFVLKKITDFFHELIWFWRRSLGIKFGVIFLVSSVPVSCIVWALGLLARWVSSLGRNCSSQVPSEWPVITSVGMRVFYSRDPASLSCRSSSGSCLHRSLASQRRYSGMLCSHLASPLFYLIHLAALWIIDLIFKWLNSIQRG